MILFPGGRIGPYEVLMRIGAGGMGEVWRARDVRLERDVAVKVLPAELAADAQFRIRFEREAKAVAQLTHPNICSLFDVGEGFLVMELLDGETLAARLQRSPLPLREVAEIGAEIADALDMAHRNGIVHRDLKPENVMLTRSGAKLLDFGLAQSAVTSTHRLTEVGMVVGTVQFMSPEQVQARRVDHRTDIFALGSLLYEAATGRCAFEGESTPSVFAAIIASDPVPIAELRPDISPALEHLIDRCLQKSPDDRWQSARDVAEELRWIERQSGAQARAAVAGTAVEPPAVIAPTAVVPAARKLPVAWSVAAALALVAVVLTVLLFAKPATTGELPKLGVTIDAPPGVDIVEFSITPDNQHIAMVGRSGGRQAVWVRHLSSLETTRLPATEGATQASFSPDGESIVFVARRRIWTLRIGDPRARQVCQVMQTRPSPVWTRRGTILFRARNAGPIQEVPAAGGTPKPATTLEAGEVSHSSIDLAEEDGLLFFHVEREQQDDPKSGLYVQRIGESEKHFVADATRNQYHYARGWLVMSDPNDGTRLLARRFDRGALRLTGEQREIPINRPLGRYVMRANGSLLMGEPVSQASVASLDRAGASTAVEARNLRQLRYSPDGARVAFHEQDAESLMVWVKDLVRGADMKLTELQARYPVWTPDGRRIVFSGTRSGRNYDIYIRNADGTGSDELLLRTGMRDAPSDISADGKWLLFTTSGNNPSDLMLVQLAKNAKPRPFASGPGRDRLGTFSPAGSHVAYTSDESGRDEVYVQAVAGGERLQVSTRGGTEPRWSRDGRELFFIQAADELAVADVVRNGDALQFAPPRRLFNVSAGLSPAYDVSPDGTRFIVNTVGRRWKRLFLLTQIVPKD